MKFGLQLGYWMAQPPQHAGELVLAAEAAGFDAVFAAESWGSDAFGPLTWWGSATQRVRLGTSVVQMSARTPAATAMHALTLDHLSGGRAVLGLGVSGPQVVEGWYGQPFAKPLQRTREYVGIIRRILERAAPVTNDGPNYPLPYTGPGATGLGKPLKPIVHPLRADLPIWLGAEGPKNVALTAEIADGWLAIYYAPRLANMYNDWLDEGFARAGARRSRADFEIAASCQVVITDDAASELERMRWVMSLYIGGMGAPEQNFHAQVYRRMGYEREVDEIGRLFQAGKKAEAAAVVPDEMILDTAIIGDEAHVRAQLKVWEAAGVTMMLVSAADAEQLRRLAPLVDM
ncbi:putative F420-dependent oxidoreductase [Nocardia brasiliensis NBRC 14402]|uniref:LLM class F420-dependent oxidoreductase n=1 Tax=Nocardia brasiliensis TaxID=37326 RepID=UPI000312FCE0|nr:LLM class F420-dependent oxidoreductase [Nocardia brasiliensis]AVL26451.1 LLM class F420-dependent oxidoreductase [Nocardia brasiliensis]GAJ81742.1 putative F420-dependent oxidoreductase [Nocardia brasiliensis NBRC 14402]SUB11166.1 Phthiodiolone/phenolphthiodiolone dimycocerosates ketoreductase [Nocardia brasiliensis]